MNLSQKQKILSEIERFEKSDFVTPFSKKYKDSATFDTITAGDYTIAELLALARKSVDQLKNRLNSDEWQVLPLTQNLNEFGSCNIHTLLSNSISFLLNTNYDQAVNAIKSLVYYEILNGFWNPPKKIDLGIRENSLLKLEQRVELLISQAEERQNIINSTISEVAQIKSSLIQFKIEKENEFKLIKQNQNESNSILSDVKNIKTQADNTNTLISNINSQCDSILTKLKQVQEDVDAKQQDLKRQNEDIETTTKRLNNEIEKESVKVQNAYETVTKHRDEVAKMMGFIADGTLSHSFNRRKKEITTSITLWSIWTILSLILLVVVVFVVFTYFSANTGNEWANIIINSVKSSPLAFMFGYALTQLSKERSLEEQYAYREAVALTLTAYLEQLDGVENTDKKLLLLQTVEKLYTNPIVKEGNNIPISTKDFTELMTKLTEAIKTIKK